MDGFVVMTPEKLAELLEAGRVVRPDVKGYKSGDPLTFDMVLQLDGMPVMCSSDPGKTFQSIE